MRRFSRFAISPTTYRRITFLDLVALAFITISGGAVRITGSGLGCSDWPACEENQFVPALDQPHAMVEFVNRLVTGAVSITVILAVLGALLRVPKRKDLVMLSVGLVVGVVAQILLGALVVLFKLTPVSVIGHYLLSIVLLWNALVLHNRAGTGAGSAVPVVASRQVLLGRILVGWGFVVLTAGTLVTGAGPHAGDPEAQRLPLAVPTAARIHGVTVVVFLVLALVTSWAIARDGAARQIQVRARVLTGSILAQAAIGYTQYFTGVPVILVALHLVGAVAVWISVVRFHLGLFARPIESPNDERAPQRKRPSPPVEQSAVPVLR
ncbi:MAG: COX15/CtaA family protein [Acidimicrobiales bacterium]|nr:COX15/CtaA family protein [Acidimicrobiales bacterium]